MNRISLKKHQHFVKALLVHRRFVNILHLSIITGYSIIQSQQCHTEEVEAVVVDVAEGEGEEEEEEVEAVVAAAARASTLACVESHCSNPVATS